ncbi:MAG: OmpH family outer membrane protein [Deltaproteobacteria bacterium]|nr:OmpH family outer membrane protein [Deltaproteobacteria bacterium]
MTKKNRLAAVLIGLVIVSSMGAKASAQNVKIAFVDLRRALNETEEGKKAMNKLSGLKNKLQKKIEGKEKSIMEMKETLEKQQNVLTKEAMQKKVEEYYRSVNELQQSYMQFQRELAGKEAEFTKGILIKMEKILAQIGKSDNYTMIYDRSSGAVVWAPSHLDLTDKLIQLYNSQNKVKGKKK